MLGKQLFYILKSLEFQCITCRIFKKHRSLFPGKPFKPDIRLYDKRNTSSLNPVSQTLPFLPGQYNTKMRHRNIMAINRIAVILFMRFVLVMNDELMPIEIII